MDQGLLKKIEPDFGHMSQRVEIINVRDVGTSFEPRIEIDYKVFFGDEYKGRYTQIAVLEKDERTVACLMGKWVGE